MKHFQNFNYEINKKASYIMLQFFSHVNFFKFGFIWSK